MNSMFNIDVSLHFEIKGSEMYGGEGSVGYAAHKWGSVRNIEQINDELIESTAKVYAEMLKVPVENVKVISKEEYVAMTGDEDDDEAIEKFGEGCHMDLIEFIKGYAERDDKYTKVYLEWIWNDQGVDEEYCFEGSPSEFVEHYTKDYDCIDGFTLDDVAELKIDNLSSCTTKIFIIIMRD